MPAQTRACEEGRVFHIPDVPCFVVASLRGGVDGRVGDLAAGDSKRLHNLRMGRAHIGRQVHPG